MKLYLNILLFAAMLSFSAKAHAQTLDELIKQYPDKYAVITNYDKQTKIYYKNGQPQIENKISVEMLMLDDKANGIYNKYYVFHGSFKDLKDLEAYTKIPDGNGFKKIKVTNIKTSDSRSSGIFYDNSKESSFDFPALVKGAYTTVKYTETITDGHLLDAYYFTSYMPIVHQSYTINYPSDMQLKYTLKNNAEKSVVVKEDGHTLSFVADNMKPQDRYGNSPKRAYYEPHVISQITSFKQDGQQANYLGNVDDLYKWNYGFLKGINTGDAPLIKHLADSLTTGITSDREKAYRIYKWVQSSIKYVAFEEGLEGFVPRQANLICSRRFGDCKDMSSILTALLKQAGLKAYFTWIGTRDIPYDYSDVALPLTDNHMIAAVELDGKIIFLDGTDPNCIFGFPSGFIQGKQALVAINEKEYKVIRVPEIEGHKSELVDSTFISFSDNGIKGKSSVYYNGYWGIEANNSLLYKDDNDTRSYVKTRMGKASNKFILGNYKVNYSKEADKLVNIQADFEVPDYSKKIADELYINMNLEKFFTPGSIIDTAKRKNGVESDFKYVIKQYTILDIPTSYTVSYMPQDYHYKDDKVGFDILYKKEANRLIATQEMRYEHLLLQPADFDKWNNVIKQVLTQYKEQVVLKQTTPTNAN